MSPVGQYQGSQAFNNINTLMKESVNPNTGSLFLSIPLVKLQGKRSSIDLTVNLFYSAGLRGTFGLPINWGLDLPYVLEGKSVTANGRTYAIDPEWTDVEGYASGLRYTNNHGIRFQQVLPPEPLPSGEKGEYGFMLSHVDGSADYFDPLGKPLEHHDVYGNFVHYSYVTGDQEGVDSPEVRIGHILDSWGQKVQFAYDQGSEICITVPDERQILIKFSSTNLHTIIDAAGNKTELEYTSFNDGAEILSRINYPSGLVSRYDYAPIGYLDDKGKAGYMPAVEDARSLDAERNVYQHMRYHYGRESAATYTGAAIGCKLGGSADSLMDNDERALEYKYDVTTLSLNQDEKPIAQTCTWFNNLHLPIEETRYLLNDRAEFVDASKTSLTYSIDKKKRSRITSYNLPTRTETFCNTSSLNGLIWQPMTRTDAEYNSYGSLVESTDWLFVEGSNHSKQRSMRTEYYTTEKKVQLPAESWDTDHISRTVEFTEYKPSQDGKSVASAMTWFQDSLEAGAQLQPWKEKSFEYDTAGRLVSTKNAWSPGAVIPDGSLASVTKRTEYAEPHNGILSRTEIDPRGNRSVIQQDLRQMNGPIVQKILPRGQTETFQYDGIGRVIKHTDALGKQTNSVYTVELGGTSTTVTSPQTYSMRTSYDVLGREIEVSDNGDPTSPMTDQISRVLSHKTYNAIGLVQESTDRFGLITKFTYDALNRPLSETDPHGNIIAYKYDDGGRTVTETVNGELRKVTQLDALSRHKRETKYPDSSNNPEAACLVHDVSYNGNGNVVQKTLSQKPNPANGMETLIECETEKTIYGPNQTVLSQTITGFTERSIDTLSREFVLDLFDNKFTYTKRVSYSDGRTFTHQGPIFIYNESNKLALYKHQEGLEERYYYDENDWPQRTVRYDGSQVIYTCDDVGQTIKVTYPSGTTTENTFNSDGKLIQIREGTDVMNYSASLDGTLTGVSYSDGRSQSFILDKFSRTVKEVDAFGVIKETGYDGDGSVNRRSCQGDTVTYSYGTANHTHGTLLGSTFRGSSEYQSSITYDRFGRLCQNTTKDSASKTLLDTVYRFDARGKVKSLESASAVFAEHNHKREFEYDGIGQVVKEVYTTTNSSVDRSVSTYAYDGNANVLSVDTDDQVVLMAYNKIDQRVDEGFKYDSNGRVIQDNEGLQYSFDERDRLLSVSKSSDAPTQYGYRSDDRLAQRHEGDVDSTTFYHNAGKVDAIHTTLQEGNAHDAKASFLSDSESVLAGYTNGKPTGHLLHQLGSTAIVMSPETHASALYNAYGVNKATSSPGNILAAFGFTQALTDQKTGLIYLNSRFYNPKQMSFLSMDTYHTENRYAYCEGDPINRIDPSGHSWVDWLATGAGIVVPILVGAAFTALSGGTASPLAVAIIGGALGGALGNVASLAITDHVGGRNVSWEDYGWGALSGATIGGLSAGMGGSAKIFAKDNFVRAVVGGASVGATVGALTETSAMLRRGESVDGARVALAAIQGAATGAAGGYWGRRTYIRQQLMPIEAPMANPILPIRNRLIEIELV